MIDDDADPETLRQFFSRTPEEIEEKKRQKWNEDWNALRMPDHLARVADTPARPSPAADLASPDGRASRYGGNAPAVVSFDAYQKALLDTIAGTESPGYDVVYTPKGPLIRMARRPDGQVDYSRHPGIRSKISNGPDKGRTSDAAGRYQILGSTWGPLQGAHKDLGDFSPANQDKAAWYLAWERYARKTQRDLAQDLRDPQLYPQVASILGGEWSSLPGGAQQRQNQAEFDRRMTDGIRRHTPTPR